MSEEGGPPPLTAHDTQTLLASIGDTAVRLVLIGGQALNYWAEQYSATAQALRVYAPYTSKDIDFCGEKQTIRELAAKLPQANYQIATLDDYTPNLGKIVFLDGQGHQREIDFLKSPYGLTYEEVTRDAVRVELLDAAGQPTGPQGLC